MKRPYAPQMKKFFRTPDIEMLRLYLEYSAQLETGDKDLLRQIHGLLEVYASNWVQVQTEPDPDPDRAP